jgi:1-acyl-sn-glycerol-3-phosphate acyltransferase
VRIHRHSVDCVLREIIGNGRIVTESGGIRAIHSPCLDGRQRLRVLLPPVMRDRIEKSAGATATPFWPPRPSGLWTWLLTPLHRHVLHRQHGIAEVTVRGMEHLQTPAAGDGMLICPNHSYTGDGSVMLELSRRSPRPFHIMAAYHVFQGHRGLDGFLLQRMGAFSIDREGCDRRAIRTATELMTSGKALVVFPEGEIYHTNEKLTPLREGVAFMAVTAQRELDKGSSGGRVWMVPVGIRYEFIDDVMPSLEAAMAKLESRVLLRPKPGTPLPERIIRYGEMLLTIKEKEQLGRSYDDDGQTLPMRLARLTKEILKRIETEHLGKANATDPVPLRVKLLRQHLLAELCEPPSHQPHPNLLAEGEGVRAALDDVHLVLQLFSYPGDYIASKPSAERMAETIEKFEEDVYGEYCRPKGRRRATVMIGEPIDVRARLGASRPRAVMTDLTTSLEAAISGLIST